MEVVRCLYHDDEHPSMCLYPETASFYCFACGVSGSYYDLLRDHGFDMKTAFTKPDLVGLMFADPKRSFHVTYIRRVHGDLVKFWEDVAEDVPYRSFGVTYPLYRGLSPDTLARWEVDYANGYVLFSSPVVFGKDPYPETVRISQLRATSMRGGYRHIGLTPKLGRIRYGQSCARDKVDETKWILVEGPFDALAVVQAIEWEDLDRTVFVVATGGALPVSLPGTVYTMFDADERGQEYADKATKLYGNSIVTLRLDPGMDPGDLSCAQLRDRLADLRLY